MCTFKTLRTDFMSLAITFISNKIASEYKLTVESAFIQFALCFIEVDIKFYYSAITLCKGYMIHFANFLSLRDFILFVI